MADRPEEPQYRQNNPESPKEQLERYLRSEIAYERESLGLEGESKRDWIGIVTDGRVWHVWEYPHSGMFKSTRVVVDFSPTTPEELVNAIDGFVRGELVGREWIPADVSELFAPFLEELRGLYAGLTGERSKRTHTKFRLWVDMLTTSSMVPEEGIARARLFVSHSFLVTLARGVIHVLHEPNADPNIKTILDDGFVAWILDTQGGRQWANRVMKKIKSYEWRRRPGDVLRPMYESIVGQKDRKAFGEFYTPDWLAELLVREVCDDDWCQESIPKAAVAVRNNVELSGIGVLDPTCGSGTFLYHAASRLVAHPSMGHRSDADKAMIVCALVHGIDVHPVAAEIARATLLRALPAAPRHEKASLRIYEGDALLASGLEDKHSLFRAQEGEIRIHTPGGSDVHLPLWFVERPEFADDLRRLVLCAMEESGVPQKFVEGLDEPQRKAICACYEQFVEIIEREGNSVWSWYIWNVTGPYLLSEKKVNRIIANPPWVTMSTIQAPERKRTLEEFAKQDGMDLWVGGTQAPHFDIAQLFVKRCRQLYLSDPGQDCAAWVVKKAAFTSGNWEKFRRWHESVLEQRLDLEKVQAFGGGDARRSCVLFDRTSVVGFEGETLVATCEAQMKPLQNEPLKSAWSKLKIVDAPMAVEQSPSDYCDEAGEPLFRNGATIFPKVLSVARKLGAGERVGHTLVQTVPSQNRPWSEVEIQQGEVPERWVMPLVTSGDLLPFFVLPATKGSAIVPVDSLGRPSSIEANANSFWQSLDEIYREYCGKGADTPKSLLANLDFSSKLTKQLDTCNSTQFVVVHPVSGDLMRGSRLRPKGNVMGHGLFWFSATSDEEAAYLVALLNAPCLREAFVQCRASGRHFSKYPWRKVPIKRYDEQNADHVALAGLTEQAEELVATWFANADGATRNLGQVGLSNRIRKLLTEDGIFPEIDEIVKKLLPEQTS